MPGIEDIKAKIKRKLISLMHEVSSTLKAKPSLLTPFKPTNLKEGFMMKKFGNPLIEGAKRFRKTSEHLKETSK